MSLATENNGRIALAEDAPQVNLEALILENHGLEIHDHPIMGRTIVATRDLDESLLYQPILRELPALVCKQHDYMDFMEQFLDAPIELQVGLLDMFYQPLDSKMGKDLIEPAKVLYVLGILEDFTVIHQLLSILMTNGHQYQGNYTAIPLFGSKFSHSCAPNMGYASLASEDGALEYKLLCPVKQGELVSFSYLSDLLETPTYERRKLLMDTKSFRCECSRCNGPDYCRCMSCPTCSEQVPCHYMDESDDAYWECRNCGRLESDPFGATERQLTNTLAVINRKIELQTDFDSIDAECSPTMLQELVQECQNELSETHHLTMKSLRLLFTSVTARAYVQIKKMMLRGLPIATPPIHSLFRQSVVAGLRLVLAGECVAAECTGCQRASIPTDTSTTEIKDASLYLQPRHKPNYDRALVVQHICDNLFRLPPTWWPPLALTMAIRYLPIMKARFGSKVAHIEARIDRILSNLECIECGTYWDAYTGERSPPQPPSPSVTTDEEMKENGQSPKLQKWEGQGNQQEKE